MQPRFLVDDTTTPYRWGEQMNAWDRRAPDHHITQNDTGTTVYEQLYDRNGNAVDLTGASVLYTARFPGGVLKVSAAATIETPTTSGIVSYRYLAADSDTDGDLLERWKVTYANGQVQRFPPSGPHKVRVWRDIA